MTSPTRAVLAGTGHYLPERIVPSSEVEAAAGKPPGWAVKRVGITERRAARPDELSWHMGAAAAADALQIKFTNSSSGSPSALTAGELDVYLAMHSANDVG